MREIFRTLLKSCRDNTKSASSVLHQVNAIKPGPNLHISDDQAAHDSIASDAKRQALEIKRQADALKAEEAIRAEQRKQEEEKKRIAELEIKRNAKLEEIDRLADSITRALSASGLKGTHLERSWLNLSKDVKKRDNLQDRSIVYLAESFLKNETSPLTRDILKNVIKDFTTLKTALNDELIQKPLREIAIQNARIEQAATKEENRKAEERDARASGMLSILRKSS